MTEKLEADLVAALARHYDAETPARTLDEALGHLARACWEHAGATPDLEVDEPAARGAIERALDFAARECREFRDARRAFRAGRFTLPGARKDSEGPGLKRTVWLMATRLWETAVDQPGSERPVFPYLDESSRGVRGAAAFVELRNWRKTADAIWRGLEQLRDAGVLRYHPDREAIRKDLQRPR